MIDWSAFTPWSSLAGGLLIGLAAALLMLLNGRIAGISGIVGGIIAELRNGLRSPGELAWRLAFVAGLLAAPVGWRLFQPLPAIHIDTDYPLLVTAGLLVGVGTRYAGGCTSGHSVCGISRRSPRSLVATAVFMISGFATVYVVSHLLGG